MNQYTIYCTEEQTMKAQHLGAPITFYYDTLTTSSMPHFIEGEVGKKWTLYFIPTAEQMIGWLENEWCGSFTITKDIVGLYLFVVRDKKKNIISRQNRYDSRKEATLAAIDAALDYLKNKTE